jgi:hypothetical protein
MLLDFTAMHVPIPGSSTSSQQHKHCLRYFASSLTSLQRKSCQFLATVLPPRYTQSHIPFSRTALHLRCQSAGGRGSGQWRRRPWHGLPCRALARDLPGTALHVASRRPDTQPSAASLAWAVVWSGEVPDGGVNRRRIDGKDAVRQSALRRATAGHTAAVSWSATGSPDTADPRSRRSRHSSNGSRELTTSAAYLHTTNPISPPSYSFSNAAAYRTNQRLLARLS